MAAVKPTVKPSEASEAIWEKSREFYKIQENTPEDTEHTPEDTEKLIELYEEMSNLEKILLEKKDKQTANTIIESCRTYVMNLHLWTFKTSVFLIALNII